MLQIQFSRPSPVLGPFIRFYVQRQACIAGSTVVHPVPARPTAMIVFDFDDRTNVLNYENNLLSKSPSVVVVGPQTYRRLEMQLRGSLDTFVISFQPDGLHRLFFLPMYEITDFDFEAHAVLGSSITRLAERLGNASSFIERVRIVEQTLAPKACASNHPDAISAAAQNIILGGGRAQIKVLADRAGLGVRQFERRFVQQVGMRPKLFSRIARFEAALEDKARSGSKSWTEVAHGFGYYDQMHMVHDFAEFSGGTPTTTLTQLEAVFVEQIRSMRTGATVAGKAANARLIL